MYKNHEKRSHRLIEKFISTFAWHDKNILKGDTCWLLFYGITTKIYRYQRIHPTNILKIIPCNYMLIHTHTSNNGTTMTQWVQCDQRPATWKSIQKKPQNNRHVTHTYLCYIVFHLYTKGVVTCILYFTKEKIKKKKLLRGVINFTFHFVKHISCKYV